MPIEVRAATTADHPAALDLLEEVAAERRYIGAEPPIDRSATATRWAEVFDGIHGAMFVAQAGDRVVGVGQMQGDGLSKLGMYVARDLRGRGIGSRLLDSCIGWARGAGVYKITLQVWPHNTAAVALYERAGFVREGYLRRHYRRRSGEIWDCVVMGLVLDPT